MHRYVVFAQKLRGFDTLEEARRFAQMNYPAVLCERQCRPDGSSELVEIVRHDYLYDADRGEWRIMLG
jgi:hypothetical protein